MDDLHSGKKEALEHSHKNKDTTRLWNIIVSIVETAFIKFFELNGKDAKVMRGRTGWAGILNDFAV